MDKDRDGKISKDKAPDELKTNFQYIDTNGDGAIEVKEAQVIADYVNGGSGQLGSGQLGSGWWAVGQWAVGCGVWADEVTTESTRSILILFIMLILSEFLLRRLVIP